jgi:hypothetical protein
MIRLLFPPIVTTSPFYKDRNDPRAEICASFDHAPMARDPYQNQNALKTAPGHQERGFCIVFGQEWTAAAVE